MFVFVWFEENSSLASYILDLHCVTKHDAQRVILVIELMLCIKDLELEVFIDCRKI